MLHNGSVGRLRLNGHGGRLEPRFARFPFGSWNQQNIFPLLGMKQRKKRAMNLPSALRDEENEDTGNLTGVEPERVARQEEQRLSEQRGQKRRLSVQGGRSNQPKRLVFPSTSNPEELPPSDPELQKPSLHVLSKPAKSYSYVWQYFSIDTTDGDRRWCVADDTCQKWYSASTSTT